MIYQLSNTIQHYAWGSRSALARLRGAAVPSAEPEAELWMGAHPLAPSRVLPDLSSLPSLIAEAPSQQLGAAVAQGYGGKLPFLLKVLAAEAPLSLQAHPSRERARAGFAAENAAGIALDAPHRNYKDENHKPELLCALDEFWALCGFRPVATTLELLSELQMPELQLHLQALRGSPDAAGLSRLFSALMLAPVGERRRLAERTAAACRDAAERGSRFVDELSWGARIGELYPGDVGVVIALTLNLLRLEAGEAIYLPAGNLHAYLAGAGVEIMASSDNVLRGGLTPKHVDVPELLHVLDFEPLVVTPLRPRAAGAERVYDTPASEFQLSYFDVSEQDLPVAIDGPEIWLVTRGTVLLCESGASPLALGAGRSAFVAASTARLTLAGSGRIFRAKVAHSA
jgi:mannose-6-phosphate isomerase